MCFAPTTCFTDFTDALVWRRLAWPVPTPAPNDRGTRRSIDRSRVAASADRINGVANEITAVLREEHGLGPGEDNDFMVRTQEDMTSMRTQTTQTMTGLLASIAGVSLIVGGIGIMNIMLVSVTERTREIGLRMAVGAKGRDVLLQFLVEAIVLSLVGGLVGVGLGFSLSEGLTQFLAWPTSVPADAVVGAVGFAARGETPRRTETGEAPG